MPPKMQVASLAATAAIAEMLRIKASFNGQLAAAQVAILAATCAFACLARYSVEPQHLLKNAD
jgi:hypothetical protein